jgi:hypothetical protein
MKLHTVSAAVLAMSLAVGSAAFAQETGSTQATQGTGDPGILEQETSMAPFYTDDTMATLRSEEEVRQAFGAMSTGDQEQMKKACIDMHSGQQAADQSQSLQDLCKMVETF